MTIIDLQNCLTTLSKKRPFFVSEADFQHCLALELENYGYTVFLEFPITIGTKKNEYIDLIVWDNKKKTYHPIELKYKTIRAQCQGSPFYNPFLLKTHSARPINRYLFWKDVFRIEQIKNQLSCSRGFVVFLTNDNNYWTPLSGTGNIDALFRLHSSICVQSVCWQNTPSAPNYQTGTVVYHSFSLLRPYTVPNWLLYSNSRMVNAGGANSIFKSLTIEV